MKIHPHSAVLTETESLLRFHVPKKGHRLSAEPKRFQGMIYGVIGMFSGHK